MPALTDSFEIAGCTIPNRLYRAPLLECAGNGPDAVDILIEELEPAAEAGAGLIFQGASIVTPESGCAAPNMTRVHNPDFVERCERLTDRIHAHNSRIFIQLAHGGIRSVEAWHGGHRDPGVQQLAASRPPRMLRMLDHLGFFDFDIHVLSTDEVYELADAFGRAAGAAVDAGYDGIHIAGANMGIVEQFASPYYNRRNDEFGGPPGEARPRFFGAILEAIRSHVDSDVPVVTKIPAESAAPSILGKHLDLGQGVELGRACAEMGYDALVPVTGTGFWDGSIVRGAYPSRAWSDRRFTDGYDAAFGGSVRRRLVALGNRLQAKWLRYEPAWNGSFCRRVREAMSIPILAEGGIRTRPQIDTLLDDGVCDAVGMARPFYAEPRLPARLLGTAGAKAACENCNNCTIPQVTGARGVCRTPSVLERRGELKRSGAYER